MVFHSDETVVYPRHFGICETTIPTGISIIPDVKINIRGTAIVDIISTDLKKAQLDRTEQDLDMRTAVT